VPTFKTVNGCRQFEIELLISDLISWSDKKKIIISIKRHKVVTSEALAAVGCVCYSYRTYEIKMFLAYRFENRH